MNTRLTLATIVSDFAQGMMLADADHPQWKEYLPGIGPHTETATIALVLAKLRAAHPDLYANCLEGVQYPGSKQRCDVCIGGPASPEWGIEVKMLRLVGDNAKPNDNMLQHILSPYPQHKSALTDCLKLAESRIGEKKAILIFGYAHSDFPLEPAIEAFELLARGKVSLGPRQATAFNELIHPVHSHGAVFGWEVLA